MDWKLGAQELLSVLKKDELKIIVKFYDEKTKNVGSLLKEELIEVILQKEKNPRNLLKRQQLDILTLKEYLHEDGSKDELRKKILIKWGVEAPDDLTPPTKISFGEDKVAQVEVIKKKIDIVADNSTSVGETTSVQLGATSRKRPAADAAEDLNLVKKIAVERVLKNWCKVLSDSGIYYSGILQGDDTTATVYDTGMVVQDRDPNSRWGYIITEGKSGANEKFILDSPLDGTPSEKVVDMFGPWPPKMNGGHGVNAQLITLLGPVITDLHSRLMAGMSGVKLKHMDLGSQLYRMLQLSNSKACRDILLERTKELYPSLTLDSNKRISNISEWSQCTGVQEDLIKDLEEMYDLSERMKVVATRLHEKLFKNRDPHNLNILSNEISNPITRAIYERRLKVLQAAENRAFQYQKESKVAKVINLNFSQYSYIFM